MALYDSPVRSQHINELSQVHCLGNPTIPLEFIAFAEALFNHRLWKEHERDGVRL